MPRKQISRNEWHELLDRETARCEAFTGRVCVNVSGGHGSAIAWHRCLEWYGKKNVVPVFADTNSEHPDLYRFLDDCENQFGQTLTRLNDGRDIWDVFDDAGILRITQAGGACKASIELKQKPLDAHFKASKADAIAVGIEFTEPERMAAFALKLEPAQVLFPLVVSPRLGECEIHEEIKRIGLKPCEGYAGGNSHNNCLRTGCILAGLGQWSASIDSNPDGFAYSEKREAAFAARTGFTVCRDQRGGKVESYSLEQMRSDKAAGREFPKDWRSQCSCMEPQPQLFTVEQCFG